MKKSETGRIDRRMFLAQGGLWLTALGSVDSLAADALREPVVRLGLLTDIHYADRSTRGTRCYRDSIGKMREAVRAFNEKKVALAFELGDMIDSAPDVETERGYLEAIDAEFRKCTGRCCHVVGNHCVSGLTKKAFLKTTGEKATYYSFDHSGFHFVVLDGCFRSDGVPYGENNFDWTDSNIPPQELAWLKADLADTTKPTCCFVHQRVDTVGHIAIKNGPQVRKVLEDSGQVLAVFQGHHHANDHSQINGIHYCTLRSVVDGTSPENSAYAIAELYADGSIRLDGFRKQDDYSWQEAL